MAKADPNGRNRGFGHFRLRAGVSIEAQLREKLRKIEAMFAGAGTAQNSAACRRRNLTVSYIETSPLLFVSFIDT